MKQVDWKGKKKRNKEVQKEGREESVKVNKRRVNNRRGVEIK